MNIHYFKHNRECFKFINNKRYKIINIDYSKTGSIKVEYELKEVRTMACKKKGGGKRK